MGFLVGRVVSCHLKYDLKVHLFTDLHMCVWYHAYDNNKTKALFDYLFAYYYCSHVFLLIYRFYHMTFEQISISRSFKMYTERLRIGLNEI